MYRYSPQSFPLTFDKTEFPHLDNWLQAHEWAWQEALATHEITRSQMAGKINGTFDHFKVGQKVWLDACHLKLGYNKKISMRWEGPFIIEEKLGPVTYQLKLLKTWKIHPTFHAILLSSYRKMEVHRPNFMKPPPDLIEGEYKYEVERILKHWRQGRSTAYLIWWKGYQPQDDSWELEWNLANAGDVLSQYKKDKKLDKWGKPKQKWINSYLGQSLEKNSSSYWSFLSPKTDKNPPVERDSPIFLPSLQKYGPHSHSYLSHFALC